MTQNANISISVFCDIVEKKSFVLFDFLFCFAFCVITILPIMFQTCLVPQNDCLNLSFVKCFHIGGTEIARNGCKMAIYQMKI